MKLKKIWILLLCLVVLFNFTACKSKKKTGEGTLRVVINWEEFATMKSGQKTLTNLVGFRAGEIPEDTSIVTHTGVRVVYPDENAAYSQSVTREIAETQGIITLQIPATTNAKMYVVAIHGSETAENRRALQLGYVDALTILEDNITTITMFDIDWTTATWYPGEDYTEYQNGLIASKEIKRFIFPIYVSDPFQVGEDVTHEQAIIKVLGRNSCQENINGWRRYDISHENTAIGVEYTGTYTFQPYLGSLFFNLPEGLYLIEPIVDRYTVTWQ
jgi:hypothetical protein